MSETKTVRVRIAVAVDAAGRYKAAGWGGGFDSAKAATASETIVKFGLPTSVAWIEADVPLPLPPEVIQGDVSPVEQEQAL